MTLVQQTVMRAQKASSPDTVLFAGVLTHSTLYSHYAYVWRSCSSLGWFVDQEMVDATVTDWSFGKGREEAATLVPWSCQLSLIQWAVERPSLICTPQLAWVPLCSTDFITRPRGCPQGLPFTGFLLLHTQTAPSVVTKLMILTWVFLQ